MRDFILIDFIIERIKKLFSLIENHTHDNLYINKDIYEIENFIKQHPNVLTIDYRIKDGNNAIISGPFEIQSDKILEIPKGSTLTII